MPASSPVEQHYHRHGLYERILQQLHMLGIDHTTRKDISGVDEFHIRGAAVSLQLAHEAGLSTNHKIIDIGCGIGGPCRMMADEFGCDVTGIDLTEAFIETARRLTQLVQLERNVLFLQADALALPFDNACFDMAWTQHAQMNIQDKRTFCTEMARVLKPRGSFIYYDVFTKKGEPLKYPVPWADDDAISFLITTAELDMLLQELGFIKIQATDQTTAGIQFFEEMFTKMAAGETPRIGLPLLIGVSSKEKFQNLYANFIDKKIELQSGIYQKQG